MKQYTPEFRKKVVAEVNKELLTLTQIAKKYNVPRQTMGTWVKVSGGHRAGRPIRYSDEDWAPVEALMPTKYDNELATMFPMSKRTIGIRREKKGIASPWKFEASHKPYRHLVEQNKEYQDCFSLWKRPEGLAEEVYLCKRDKFYRWIYHPKNLKLMPNGHLRRKCEADT
jgi:hypothetical protein